MLKKHQILGAAPIVLALSTLALATLLLGCSKSIADERQITIARISASAAACQDYRKVTGQWPTNFFQIGWVIPIPHPQIFTDGWNNMMVIVIHSNVPNQLSLRSYGADGHPGGLGTNADVLMGVY